MVARVLALLSVFVPAAARGTAAQCPDGGAPPCAGESRPALVPQAQVPTPRYRRLTTSGTVERAALSPDGRLLAYVDSGVLWVRDVAGDEPPRTISRDYRLYSAMVRWFADGTRLLTVGAAGGFVIPLRGAGYEAVDAHMVLGAPSPDGSRVAYANPGWKAFLVRELGAARPPDTVRVPGTYRRLADIEWSPDGRFFLVRTEDDRLWGTLLTIRASGEAAQVVFTDLRPGASPRWDAGSSSFYYLRETGIPPTSSVFDLWRIALSAATGARAGEDRLALPLLEGRRFDLVNDGRHLAFVRSVRTSSVWMARIGPDTTRRWLTAAPLYVALPRVSPDGRLVAFVRGDGVFDDVFVMPVDSGEETRITREYEQRILGLAWSPSGQRIVYCAAGRTRPRLRVVTLGSSPREVRTRQAVGAACHVQWGSEDEILYGVDGGRGIGVVSLAGGPEDRLPVSDSEGTFSRPRSDPTGQRVAVRREWTRGRTGLWVISRRDSSARQLRDSRYEPVRWSHDGRTLYAVGRGWLLRLGESAADSVAATHGRPCDDPEVSPDGSLILCTVRGWTTDAWLIEDFDPAAPRQRPPTRP